MTDPKGALLQPIRGSAPEMTVLVDTVTPVLRLEAVETTPGHVSVAWTASDRQEFRFLPAQPLCLWHRFAIPRETALRLERR